MRHLLLIILVVVMTCIGGMVWAKAIYIPRAGHPGGSGTIRLHTGGGISLHSGGILDCHTC